jgi:hypothetical protein
MSRLIEYLKSIFCKKNKTCKGVVISCPYCNSDDTVDSDPIERKTKRYFHSVWNIRCNQCGSHRNITEAWYES